MSKKEDVLWIDGAVGSQLRDTQGETLSVEGADISELEAGKGRWNADHGKGFYNSLGRITGAKKIFGPEDCDNERHEYYWEKIKAPFIYAKGYLYEDDHPHAKAAAAIIRNIHKTDSPLKMKASVEGGVIARGIKDSNLLARTRINQVALTFVPANNATLIECTNLDKSSYDQKADYELMKSFQHLAIDADKVPSFKQVKRSMSAHKIISNIEEIKKNYGIELEIPGIDDLIQSSIEHKIQSNISKINELVKTSNHPHPTHPLKHDTPAHKMTDEQNYHHAGRYAEWAANTQDDTLKNELISMADHHRSFVSPGYRPKLNKALTAGYGGAGEPTGRTGGSVIQTESLDDGRNGIDYIGCDNCGKDQVYGTHQVRCRGCGKAFSFEKLAEHKLKKKHKFNEALEKASKKQLNQMTGNPEVSSWIKQHIPRDDLALWFARSYKQNPEIFNDSNKQKIEHYGSVMDQHKELQDLRLDKSHDFDKGMDALREANETAEKRAASNPKMVAHDGSEKKLMDTGDGYAWYSLGKGSCPKEAQAMGHCGNKPSEEEGDDILSLRQEVKHGDKTYYKPVLTFINNEGHLGEMKGRANQKPAEKYHDSIKQLLMSDHVDKIVGGGYEADKNFSLSDMPEDMQKEIKEAKPDINELHDSTRQIDAEKYPEKHAEEIYKANYRNKHINEAFKKHGDLGSIIENGGEQADHVYSHPAFKNHITEEMTNKMMENPTLSAFRSALDNYPHHVSEDHIRKVSNIFKNGIPDVDMDSDFDENWGTMSESDEANDLMSSAMNHPKAANVLKEIAGIKHPFVEHAINSKYADKDVFDAAFNSGIERNVAHSTYSKHFGPEHMEQALNNESPSVRAAAVKSKHFSPEHMEQVLKDEDKWVRRNALMSEHATKEHVEQGLGHKDDVIREAAPLSPAFSKEHMEQAMADSNPFVRVNAVESKHFGPEHMEQALKDESMGVVNAAKKSPHFNEEKHGHLIKK